MTTIVTMAIWAIFFFKTMKAECPLSFRIQNGIFTLLLVGLNVSPSMLTWAIGHPHDVPASFWYPIGYLPAWLVCGSRAAFTFLGLVSLLVGFELISRNKKSRQHIRVLIPFLTVCTPIEMMTGASRAAPFKSSSDVTLSLVVFIISTIALYAWMFLFYGSKTAKENLNTTKTDPDTEVSR
jgi:hypothetical protein